MEEIKKLDEILEITNTNKLLILNSLLLHHHNSNIIDISQDVYKDTNIDKWIENLPELEGSKILINDLIHNPINDRTILEKRQKSFIDYDISFDILKEHENDILWAFSLNNEIKEDFSIHLLYPSTYIINYINYIEPFLDLYHLYKIYIIPILILLYPISIFLAPLYFLNKNLNMNISFNNYINMFYSFLKFYLQSTGNFKLDLIKFITLLLYIGIYGYNIYQTFEVTYLLYKTKEKLQKKMQGLVFFVNEANNIINSISLNILEPYLDENIIKNYKPLNITTSMTDIYMLWKDNSIKDNIKTLLKIIYTIDIINSISKLHIDNNWCLVNYTNDNTLMWNMKNPLLNDKQISNPVKLSKNIIITGPNAAGKTTYVKSILSNIILSQTFGIANCLKAEIIIYDSICSFMRITDILGSKSYFEVETEYCSNMIKKAIDLSDNNKKGLFLMDEPMHSTPPTEGMATAYAVIEFIGKLKGLNLIITTHFHKLTSLEDNYPNHFINLSVNAIKKKDNTFYFSYKIKKGFSYQCIAIELLEKQKFPIDVINSAIEIKNKICNEIYSK